MAVELNNGKWAKIKSVTGLPDEARDRITSIIQSYVSLEERRCSGRLSPATVRKKLQLLSVDASKLIERLDCLVEDAYGYSVLVRVGPDEWHPSSPEISAQ